jgi:hypothetical protein
MTFKTREILNYGVPLYEVYGIYSDGTEHKLGHSDFVHSSIDDAIDHLEHIVSELKKLQENKESEYKEEN